MPDDWADRTAAQIMVVAFAGGDSAREQIAQILWLVHQTGRSAGLREMQEPFDESCANFAKLADLNLKLLKLVERSQA